MFMGFTAKLSPDPQCAQTDPVSSNLSQVDNPSSSQAPV